MRAFTHARTAILGAAAAMLVIACNQADMMRRFTPADADARARGYLALLRRGQVDSAMVRLVPQLATPEARAELARVSAILGPDPIDTSWVVGAQVNKFDGTRHTNLTYEMHSRSGWVLANVAMVDSGSAWLVEGAGARPLERPLEEINRFTLDGKPPLNYLWLLLTVLSAALALGTAIFLAARRGMPGRWWWALLSLFGIGAFSLNWTTGATGVNIMTVQLGGFGVFKAGPAAPWIVAFALPVGAILAITRYRGWRARPPVVPARDDASAAGAA